MFVSEDKSHEPKKNFVRLEGCGPHESESKNTGMLRTSLEGDSLIVNVCILVHPCNSGVNLVGGCAIDLIERETRKTAWATVHSVREPALWHEDL